MWTLLTVPAAAVACMACLIAWGSNPAVAQLAGVGLLVATASAFVVVPVAIYVLVANRELRTFPQVIGTALCALPILGVIASISLWWI